MVNNECWYLGVVGNYPVSKLEAFDVLTHGSNDANSLMARNQWKLGNKFAYTDVSKEYGYELATSISLLAFFITSKRVEGVGYKEKQKHKPCHLPLEYLSS